MVDKGSCLCRVVLLVLLDHTQEDIAAEVEPCVHHLSENTPRLFPYSESLYHTAQAFLRVPSVAVEDTLAASPLAFHQLNSPLEAVEQEPQHEKSVPELKAMASVARVRGWYPF